MKQADISYVLRFEPVPAGTRMQWSGEVSLKGAFGLLAPVAGWLGRRQEQQVWQNMKQRLEG